MKEVSIGAQVECTDGPAGQTTSLVVDPKSLMVTHYVVKEKESPHAERLVPAEQVLESSPELIRLACTSGEFSELEPFRFTDSLGVAGHGIDNAGQSGLTLEGQPDDCAVRQGTLGENQKEPFAKLLQQRSDRQNHRFGIARTAVNHIVDIVWTSN